MWAKFSRISLIHRHGNVLISLEGITVDVIFGGQRLKSNSTSVSTCRCWVFSTQFKTEFDKRKEATSECLSLTQSFRQVAGSGMAHVRAMSLLVSLTVPHYEERNFNRVVTILN